MAQHTPSTVEELLLKSPVRGHEGQCLVCYSDLEYPTLTPCGHDEVCGTCHLRLRFLHGDKKCPMCKTLNEQLICDHSGEKQESFHDYPLWGNELGGNFTYKPDVGMFFPTSYYESEIEPLFGYQCLHCKDYDGTTPDDNIIYEQQQQQQPKHNKTKKQATRTSPLRGLQDHLRNAHRLALCQLCVQHKRDFVSALPRYTPSQLKHHLQHGDGQGSRGHPLCEFCRPTRFYDLHELHVHLARDHYKCHVCEKQGLENQYFRNYQSLEHHFELQHFLCGDAQCRAARFVVFENEIDLRGHELSTHGATSSGSTKIQLEFRYRRSRDETIQQNVPTSQDFEYGLDGRAFCPDDALEENANTQGAPNEETSHPLHLQRTNELRAHAAEIRTRRQLQEAPEAFPSLQGSSNTATAALRVGWSSGASSSIGRRNEMAAENFPSLPITTSTFKNSTRAKLKSINRGSGGGGVVSGNRTFAAMQSATRQPSSGWSSGGGTTTTTAAAAAVSTSSFPSLSSSTIPTSTNAASRVGNRESNLTQDNFPSLGGTSSSTPRYVAAENLAREKKAAPSFSSTTDFPPPPSSTKPAAARSIRQELLAPPTKPPPAVDNILDFPPPPSTHVTVDEIKATLGSQKYKELKRLTKEFAADSIAPDAYVDHAASLFEQGYADVNFWSFLPSLLQSCPNTMSANRAQEYMEQLRRNQASVAVSSATSHVGTSSASGSGWSNMPPNKVITASVARKPVASTLNTSWSSNSAVARAGKPNNKAAWNAGSTSSVARAKQKPGSVTVAAQETSNQSTATKYMADQTKKNKAKQETKKAKKKQNDELRALAFGGK